MTRLLVYALIDPRNGELRYIGKSTTGLARPRAHRVPSRLAKDRTYKANWIRSLEAVGVTYDIEVLEECVEPELLSEAESFWIAYFRMLGCRLTNLTNGGDGLRGYRQSEQTKSKRAAAHRGMKRSSECRARMSVAQLGNKHNLGHTLSNVTRVKISVSMCGRKKAPLSDDHKRRIAEGVRRTLAEKAHG